MKIVNRVLALPVSGVGQVFTQVLLGVQTRGQHRLLRQHPAGTRGHFGCNTLRWQRMRCRCFYGGLRTSAGTGSKTSSVLRMDRGLVMRRCLEDVLSLWGLKLRECAFCAACEGGGHILSAAEREGATPCSAVESLRRDDADTEVGPETGPQKDHGAHHATRTRLAAPWMN